MENEAFPLEKKTSLFNDLCILNFVEMLSRPSPNSPLTVSYVDLHDKHWLLQNMKGLCLFLANVLKQRALPLLFYY